jgi:wyosine [tRNA(Phe)-imidazoG37] synthetase (radical SAM superfamily)
MKSKAKYTYGPVPSRRLGFSLGIDIMPFKHCTFDCIYCQLGRTTHKTTRRAEYTPADDIVAEIEQVLLEKASIDYLTFSGSGEPTLHERLGYIITRIKDFSELPVAVLTNGSLLYLAAVRKDLDHADVVAPTLCGTTDEIIQRIHQPAAGIRADTIISGLLDFRKGFRGELWLEVMLIQGVNDADDRIERLNEYIQKISPEKIHLNTVVRPPRDKNARPVPAERLHAIKKIFGDRCEIIADFKKQVDAGQGRQHYKEIIDIIRRRPVTLDDIVRVTGLHAQEILKYLGQLVSENRIRYTEHHGQRYYEGTETS